MHFRHDNSIKTHRIRSQLIFKCTSVKMCSPLVQVSILLLLLNHGLPNNAAPMGPQFGQQSHFGEGVRDWFVNMKDRVFGNYPPNVSPMLSQAREDIERERNAIAGFFLDLTRVSFDPSRDWGFHVGQWYFIKKGKDPAAGGRNDPPTRPTTPEDPPINWFDENTSKNQPEFPEGPDPSPVESTTLIEPEESSEISPSTPAIDEKANETYNPAEGPPSAEVIGPHS